MGLSTYVISTQNCAQANIVYSTAPKHYIADAVVDMPSTFPAGSICYVLATGGHYLAEVANTWTSISGGGGSAVDSQDNILANQVFGG